MMGWSMGGIITLTVAANNPDAVNRIVVTDTTSGGPGKGAVASAQCPAALLVCTQHSTAWHGTARHGTAQHSIAQHNAAQYGIASY